MVDQSDQLVLPVLTSLAQRIDRPSTVLDIGGFRGLMTDNLLRIYPDSAVHVFEPLPERSAQLRDKYSVNERVQVHAAAVSDKNGSAAFHVGSFEPTSSLFPRNKTGQKYFNPDFEMSGTIDVPTVTLDHFCADQHIDHVSCLKLDTQGAEHMILTGAHDLLENAAIDVVFTEWFAVPHYEGTPLFDEIWALLSSHRYSLFDLFPGPRAPNGQLRYGDAIFVSPKVRESVLSA